MDLLNKLTIKNLKLNKKRTIVTIIGIMLSVALITAVAGIYTSAIYSLTDFEKTRNGDFHVAFYDIPTSELGVFENNREIEQVNLTQNIGYAKIDSKNDSKPYAYIKSFTKSSLENLSIRLVEGRLPENDTEILIPTHLKTNGRLELKVGEEIALEVGKRVDSEGYELKQDNPYQDNSDFLDDENITIDTVETNNIHNETSNEKIIDTTIKTYKIVGIIERPAGNIESYTAPGYTFITYMDDNNLSGNFDVYARFTNDGLKNIYKITANIIGVNDELFEKFYLEEGNLSEDEIKQMSLINIKYQYNINQYLVGLETDPIGTSALGGLEVVVGIVIGIIVVTSVFCIKNSFDISITEKIKQYGMLRSIGATKKQIKKNVFYEASILGIIGIPLGILIGFIATFVLIIISNLFLTDILTQGFALKFAFSFIAVILAIILGIITIYFSGFKSARRASKVSPIDSIRNSGNIKINPKKIKSSKIVKKIFGIGGEISYKNLKRNKKKYRTTVISIVVSVFVFIALSSFMQMAFKSIDFYYGTNEYNITLYMDGENANEQDVYKKLIETTNFDNVENVSIVRNRYYTIENPQYLSEYRQWCEKYERPEENYVTIYSVGTIEYNNYLEKLGLNYDEMKDKGILVNSYKKGVYSEEANDIIYEKVTLFNYKTGDKISGIINDEKQYEFNIGYITDENPFGLKGHEGVKLIVSDDLFETINVKPKVVQNVTAMYYSNTPDKLQDNLEQLLKNDKYDIYNEAEQVRMMENLYTLVGIFLYGFIIVISLIGITNIFNTITTNMELRRSEFAMLKSIGMTTKEFNKMIRLESIFMGMKSLIFGIPIGLGLSYLIYHFLMEESGNPYNPPIIATAISIITVFILISIIMKYSINKINKQNTIETIRNENI